MPPRDDKSNLTNTSTDITIAVLVLLIILSVFGAYIGSAVGWYAAFIEWLYSKNWSALYKIAAVAFGVFDVVLIWFIIFTLRRYRRLNRIMPVDKPILTKPVVIEDETNKTWIEVQRLADSSSPSDWNMAVIRADGLLDEALRDRGYEGETVAERLKIVDPTKLPSLERVWSAHRLRNLIVHGPLEAHPKETITFALRSYELALKELGVLKK